MRLYRKKYLILSIGILLTISCNQNKSTSAEQNEYISGQSSINTVSLIVLGNVQDAGSPLFTCTKKCCKNLFANPDPTRKVVSLGLIDPFSNSMYLFEATPDITDQIRHLDVVSGFNSSEIPDGIFLTHAHIGHYAGLMYLGKEAMNSSQVPVYVLPRMKTYLETNGP